LNKRTLQVRGVDTLRLSRLNFERRGEIEKEQLDATWRVPVDKTLGLPYLSALSKWLYTAIGSYLKAVGFLTMNMEIERVEISRYTLL